MTKILALTNHKGGVGKTTSVACIGAALARMGKRTLLIDLDAQQNLTYSFLNNEDSIEPNIYGALVKGEPLPIMHLKERLDLCPSSIELARAEIDLSTKIAREQILKNRIENVADNYDYILLDCPPSLGIITMNALAAASSVYICLVAEALPLQGLTMLEDIIEEIRRGVNKDLKLSGVFLTRYNRRNLNEVIEEAIKERYGSKVLTTRIRENISLAEAPLTGNDIFEYKPTSNGAQDYEALTREILEREE